jgi:anthranilate phosphoribosyltransferase
MRMALRVEWSDVKPGAKIIKLHYKKLTDEEIGTVITLYKRWMQMVLERLR